MRTKCAISDAFVRDCVFAYCASVAQYVHSLSAEHCFRLRNNAISDERFRDCALSTYSVFRPLVSGSTLNIGELDSCSQMYLHRIQCLCEEHYNKYHCTYCHDLFLGRKKSSSMSKTLLFCDISATSHCQTINISKSEHFNTPHF